MIVTQAVTGYDDPQEVRRLQRGDYFGEKALLRYMARYPESFFKPSESGPRIFQERLTENTVVS